LKTKQVRPQRRLLGGESAVEGDRISPLESHWQRLEQVSCFPGVFSDGCDSSAQLHCLVVPVIITSDMPFDFISLSVQCRQRIC